MYYRTHRPCVPTLLAEISQFCNILVGGLRCYAALFHYDFGCCGAGFHYVEALGEGYRSTGFTGEGVVVELVVSDVAVGGGCFGHRLGVETYAVAVDVVAVESHRGRVTVFGGKYLCNGVVLWYLEIRWNLVGGDGTGIK